MTQTQKAANETTAFLSEDRFAHLKNHANELKKSRLRENTARHRAAWTPARKLAQSARAKATAPWTRSTGPRTADGKAASRSNALKHGRRSCARCRFTAAIAAHSCWLNILKTLYRLGRPKPLKPAQALLCHLRLARYGTRLRALSRRAGIDTSLPFGEAFIDYLGDMASTDHDRIGDAEE